MTIPWIVACVGFTGVLLGIWLCAIVAPPAPKAETPTTCEAARTLEEMRDVVRSARINIERRVQAMRALSADMEGEFTRAPYAQQLAGIDVYLLILKLYESIEDASAQARDVPYSSARTSLARGIAATSSLSPDATDGLIMSMYPPRGIVEEIPDEMPR